MRILILVVLLLPDCFFRNLGLFVDFFLVSERRASALLDYICELLPLPS